MARTQVPSGTKGVAVASMKSEEVTDMYLADLAAKHGARLGTLDQTIADAAVDVIAR